jgi:hypothetical protein
LAKAFLAEPICSRAKGVGGLMAGAKEFQKTELVGIVICTYYTDRY